MLSFTNPEGVSFLLFFFFFLSISLLLYLNLTQRLSSLSFPKLRARSFAVI